MTDRMKELFDMARTDGPSETARDSMWTGIQTATLGAAGAPSALATIKGAGILSSKLALGIALGASMTVGVAATVFAITRPNAPTHSASVASPRTLDRDELAQDRPVEAVRPPVVITGHVGDTVELKDEPQRSEREHVAIAPLSEHDRLAREARMVSEARGALHRGDAEQALHIVRAARATTGARMVPEELTVEAQALRALGDEDGAKRIDAELAGKFPEQAPEQAHP